MNYFYDPNGSVTFDSTSSQTLTYLYDKANRIKQAKLGAVVIGEYNYDGENKRVRNTASSIFLYNQSGNLLSEFTADGEWLADYIWANGELIARSAFPEVITEGPMGPGLVQVHDWYHLDHLGTPLAMTHAGADLSYTVDLDPFGNVLGESSTLNEVRFPGQFHDRETGNYYNWHRYYRNKIARYYQKDLTGITAEAFDENFVINNLYAYAASNAVKFTDPFGLWTNPTGGKIRGCDCPPCGCGHWHASRTRRGVQGIHEGVDYVGKVGGPAFATISGYLRPDNILKTITIKGTVDGKTYLVVLRHITPTAKEGRVKEGQQVGIVEDITSTCQGITPHIHLELYRMIGGEIQYPPMNPTKIIPLPGGTK